MIKWMESQGYDMTYVTSVDLETNPSLLTGHRVFVNTGHDEYYSDTMRARIQNAIDSGVNMAFFSANNIYFRITCGRANATGRRTGASTRDKGALAGSTTVEWRNLPPPLRSRRTSSSACMLERRRRRPAVPRLRREQLDLRRHRPPHLHRQRHERRSITSGAARTRLPGVVGYEFDARAVDASSPVAVRVATSPPASADRSGTRSSPPADERDQHLVRRDHVHGSDAARWSSRPGRSSGRGPRQRLRGAASATARRAGST